MRFFAVNMTGTAIHVRLDRDAGDNLVLTLSKRKSNARGRPLTEFVMVTKTPVRIHYLDEDAKFDVRNPDRIKYTVGIDHERDKMLHVRGFMH